MIYRKKTMNMTERQNYQEQQAKPFKIENREKPSLIENQPKLS